jgi:hypothetical protein
MDIDIEESDDNVDGHFTERKIKLISLLVDRLLLGFPCGGTNLPHFKSKENPGLGRRLDISTYRSSDQGPKLYV